MAIEVPQKIDLTAKVAICDIEGTTTSIEFVKDTLFEYAKKHVKDFLTSNWDKDEVKAAITKLVLQAKEDVDNKLEGVVSIPEQESDKDKMIEALTKNVEWQIKNDRKTTSLKNLQSLIWKLGYEEGVLKGHVYDDVPKAFQDWTSAGVKIYIYSSGSVEAQKMLFASTKHGDMLPYISGHFDTVIGKKQEKDSYSSILKEINCSGDEVVFLTDIPSEAKAAKDAGLEVILLNRPGNAELSDDEKKLYKVVKTFEDIIMNKNAATEMGKRKIDEKSEQEPAAKIHKTDGTPEEELKNGTTVEVKKTEDKPIAKDAVEEKMDVDDDVAVVSQKDETKTEVDNTKTEKTDDKTVAKSATSDENEKSTKMQVDGDEENRVTDKKPVEGKLIEKSDIEVTKINEKTDTVVSTDTTSTKSSNEVTTHNNKEGSNNENKETTKETEKKDDSCEKHDKNNKNDLMKNEGKVETASNEKPEKGCDVVNGDGDGGNVKNAQNDKMKVVNVDEKKDIEDEKKHKESENSVSQATDSKENKNVDDSKTTTSKIQETDKKCATPVPVPDNTTGEVNKNVTKQQQKEDLEKVDKGNIVNEIPKIEITSAESTTTTDNSAVDNKNPTESSSIPESNGKIETETNNVGRRNGHTSEESSNTTENETNNGGEATQPDSNDSDKENDASLVESKVEPTPPPPPATTVMTDPALIKKCAASPSPSTPAAVEAES